MNTNVPSPLRQPGNPAILVIFPLLTLLALALPLPGAPTYEIVAEEDQAAPAPGGGTDSTFNDFNAEGAISSAGDIVAGGTAAGFPIAPTIRGAHWFRAAGTSTVDLLARVEEPAPGVLPAANFSSISAPLTPTGPANALGQVAFLGGIPGSVIFGTDVGVWVGNPGALSIVALSNAPADVIGGGVLYEEIHPPVLSDSGATAFATELQGTGVGGSNNIAIYAGTPGSLVLVAREGSPAPGRPVGTNFRVLYDPLIDPAGNLCFCADTTGATSESGYWAGPPASILPIVMQGDPAPGLTAGTTFGAFDIPECFPSWNGSQIAFASSVTDNGTFRVGIWAGSPGAFTFIAATGLNAPGLGLPILPTNGMIGNPVISASGHVAFRAKLDTADPGVTSGDDEVLFYGPIGSIQPLLREGDPVPGDPTRTVASFPQGEAFEMGPDGSLAFDMSSSPSVFQDEIWVARPDNSIVPLALHDQLVDAGGQEWQIDGANFIASGQVSFIIDRTGHNGSDGRPSAFGPNSTFLFTARMAPTAGGSNRDVLVLANLDGAPAALVLPELAVELHTPAANDVRITVETVSGQDYTLYRADNLQNWVPIAGPFAGTGGQVLVDDLGILASSENYYRAITQ